MGTPNFTTTVAIDSHVIAEFPRNGETLGELLNRLCVFHPDIRALNTSSDNSLPWIVGQICSASQTGKDLPLLKLWDIFEGDRLHDAALQLSKLLKEIECNPEIVLQATKEKYEPLSQISFAGTNEWHPFTKVYPDDVRVLDGWAYFYTHSQVRDACGGAPIFTGTLNGVEQINTGDINQHDFWTDGEMLDRVFCFFKSQLALLMYAIDTKRSVLYVQFGGIGHEHLDA
jgi:hypothetical protein